MKCPLCSVDLVMSERQGIEIDYCPQCRGVWLDRGELDKIIERSAVEAPVPSASPRNSCDGRWDREGRDYDRDWERRRDRDYDRDRDYRHGSHKKKKRGFLEDLFEFGD